MGRIFIARVLLTATAIVLLTGSCASQSSGESSAVVVAVVESRIGGAEGERLEYSVLLGDVRLETAAAVIDGFRTAGVGRVAILLDQNVPVGVVPSLVSMASKAIRNPEYRLFVVAHDRTGMMAIPGFKWVEFSTDPVVVGGFFN